MTAGDRYERLFARLRAARQGAFVPFTVVGDPELPTSAKILRTLVAAGADALELGLPYSDPVADGSVIQQADRRALAAGVRTDAALACVGELRAAHPEIPIGLLVYVNLVLARGASRFYAAARAAGVDSVLIADVPTLEAGPFVEAALAQGVAPVLIATASCTAAQRRTVATWSRGYVYVVTRAGVTGADERAQIDHAALVAELHDHGAPPALLGFGISRPDHVRAALRTGAAGAIAGSAVVARIEQHLDRPEAMLAALAAYVAEMKAATLP